MSEEMFEIVNELLEKVLEKNKDKDPIMKALYLEHKIDAKGMDLPTKLKKIRTSKVRRVYTARRRVFEQNKRILGR